MNFLTQLLWHLIFLTELQFWSFHHLIIIANLISFIKKVQYFFKVESRLNFQFHVWNLIIYLKVQFH